MAETLLNNNQIGITGRKHVSSARTNEPVQIGGTATELSWNGTTTAAVIDTDRTASNVSLKLMLDMEQADTIISSPSIEFRKNGTIVETVAVNAVPVGQQTANRYLYVIQATSTDTWSSTDTFSYTLSGFDVVTNGPNRVNCITTEISYDADYGEGATTSQIATNQVDTLSNGPRSFQNSRRQIIVDSGGTWGTQTIYSNVSDTGATGGELGLYLPRDDSFATSASTDNFFSFDTSNVSILGYSTYIISQANANLVGRTMTVRLHKNGTAFGSTFQHTFTTSTDRFTLFIDGQGETFTPTDKIAISVTWDASTGSTLTLLQQYGFRLDYQVA